LKTEVHEKGNQEDASTSAPPASLRVKENRCVSTPRYCAQYLRIMLSRPVSLRAEAVDASGVLMKQ
jgi:hypothetical protein